ncbi:MAG TPA: hypothetical protein PK156_08530 [Polyangium sp.]|nr:hypothetical protein [Polyangium sp.]
MTDYRLYKGMRPLEVLVFIVAFVALVATLPFKKQRPRVSLGLWAGAATFAVVQTLVEKPRWQMYPAYGIIALFAMVAFFSWRRQPQETISEKPRRWPRVLAVVLGVLIMGVSTALAILLPVFSFEPPTGPFAVGTTTYEWVDMARTDEHPQTPTGHRRLVVEVRYPAAASDAPREPYMDAQRAEAFAQSIKMPGLVMSHLSLVRTNARRDIPIAAGEARFPVILFSHGYPLPAATGTFAVEELASQGYVVVSISHTYDTSKVVFRDGTSGPLVMNGDVGRIDKVEKLLGPRISVWVADARFVVNEIMKLDSADARFKGRLDLDRIGYFGHSFGGATAFATLAADPRIKAGIDMDGAYFGAAAQARPTQPFMLMSADKIVISDEQIKRAGLDGSGVTRKDLEAFLDGIEAAWSASVAPGKDPRYRARFAGVSHMGFSDLPLMIPAIAAGSLPVPKAHRLINQYIGAFFEEHLKGLSSPLLRGPAADPAVTFSGSGAAL